jgi:hypothetical protein
VLTKGDKHKEKVAAKTVSGEILGENFTYYYKTTINLFGS